MNKTNKVVLITLISFGSYFLIDEMYFKEIRQWLYKLIYQWGISHILAYFIVGSPIFIGTLLLHNKETFIHSLGLEKSLFLKGMLFSLLCTLPMFIGYVLLFDVDAEFSLNTFLITIIAAAFFEELYFRGFLFGQIYRYTNWGFIPSVFIRLVATLFFAIIYI
jgi:membrane protease YdiL (CAAX protease family)